MKKLFLNIVAIIALALFAAPVMANYVLEQGPEQYPDLPQDHWAYEAVTFLTDKKVVVGYPDGLYRPDQKVTRAEFSTMVLKALGLYEKDIPQIFDFSDIDKHWAKRNIQAAAYYGLVKGYPDGTFKPNEFVTRLEALNVILSALEPNKIDKEQAEHFLSIYEDYSLIPDWALISAGQCQAMGLVYNTPGHETTLEPYRYAVRGELARFLLNMTKAVQIAPSPKIKEAMKPAPPQPKKADGYVLDNVYYDEDYAVIPEGTVLPLTIDRCINTKTVKEGTSFVARTPYNFVTREKYLLIPIGVQIDGKVHKVKRPTRFVKNGYMALTTSNVINDKGQPDMKIVASLAEREADMRIIRNDPYLTRTRYNVVKGQNMYIHRGQRLNFVLLEPLKVQILNVENDM